MTFMEVDDLDVEDVQRRVSERPVCDWCGRVAFLGSWVQSCDWIRYYVACAEHGAFVGGRYADRFPYVSPIPKRWRGRPTAGHRGSDDRRTRSNRDGT